MRLIICEKPKVAEKLARALGKGKYERKTKGKASYYELEHNGNSIRVVAAVGHIYGLRQKEKGSAYPIFDIEWAPSYEINKTSAFTKAYLKLIERAGFERVEVVSESTYPVEAMVDSSDLAKMLGDAGRTVEDAMRLADKVLSVKVIARKPGRRARRPAGGGRAKSRST